MAMTQRAHRSGRRRGRSLSVDTKEDRHLLQDLLESTAGVCFERMNACPACARAAEADLQDERSRCTRRPSQGLQNQLHLLVSPEMQLIQVRRYFPPLRRRVLETVGNCALTSSLCAPGRLHKCHNADVCWREGASGMSGSDLKVSVSLDHTVMLYVTNMRQTCDKHVTSM